MSGTTVTIQDSTFGGVDPLDHNDARGGNPKNPLFGTSGEGRGTELFFFDHVTFGVSSSFLPSSPMKIDGTIYGGDSLANLVKTGPGTLELGGDNVIPYEVHLNDGRINIGNDNALGTSATVVANGTSTTLGTPLINTPHDYQSSTSIYVQSGTLHLDTPFGGHRLTFSGSLTSEAAASIQKTGPGDVTLNGSSSVAGNISVLDGSLTINALDNANLSQLIIARDTVADTHGIFALSQSTAHANTVSGAGTIQFFNTSSLTADNASGFTGTIFSNGTTTLSLPAASGSLNLVDGSSTTIRRSMSSTLIGSGVLAVQGFSNLDVITHSGDNTQFTGNIHVQTG